MIIVSIIIITTINSPRYFLITVTLSFHLPFSSQEHYLYVPASGHNQVGRTKAMGYELPRTLVDPWNRPWSAGPVFVSGRCLRDVRGVSPFLFLLITRGLTLNIKTQAPRIQNTYKPLMGE